MIDGYRVTIELLLLATIMNQSAIEALPLDFNSTTHRAFADKLTSGMYKKENECSSALGISMAFSLIYPGSTYEGADEVQHTLGYLSSPEEHLMWNETSSRLMQTYHGQCHGMARRDGECMNHVPTMKIANRVYFHDDNPLDSTYKSLVGDYVEQIDFDAKNSSSIVNKWVESKTGGLIKEIVPKGVPIAPCELLVVNAMYLKASWDFPFAKDKTSLDSFFYDASRNIVVSQAHFMNGVLDRMVPYSNAALPGYQVVQLPFVASEMSMIIVLPTRVDSEIVPSSKLLAILDNLEATQVALSMPKFKFQSAYDEDLKRAIKQTGIVAPFDGHSSDGALCGLFSNTDDCEKLYIDKVIQKTHIDVNENGVEAAAATVVKVLYRSAPRVVSPMLMIVDHPFQFFIYDRIEDLVLFEGRVGKPGVPVTKPEVELLDALHSEPDFWLDTFGVVPIDPTVTSSEDKTRLVPTEATPSSSEGATRKRKHHRTRDVCINLGRFIGTHTFSIPRQEFKWMRWSRNGLDGARRGECNPYKIRRLRKGLEREHKFCRRFRRKTLVVRAPAAAREWLKRRGITEGQCDDSKMIGDEIHMELIE